MPVTSTAINGCDAKLWIDNASGVLTDISGMANEFSMELNKDLGEFKVFGDPWRYRLECGKDASIDLQVIYSRDVDGGLDILRDWYFNGSGARTVRIMLPREVVGGDSYELEAMLESLSIPVTSDEAGPIMVSATLKPNGPVVYSVLTT